MNYGGKDIINGISMQRSLSRTFLLIAFLMFDSGEANSYEETVEGNKLP